MNAECLLSGVKQTSSDRSSMSAFDPESEVARAPPFFVKVALRFEAELANLGWMLLLSDR